MKNLNILISNDLISNPCLSFCAGFVGSDDIYPDRRHAHVVHVPPGAEEEEQACP